MSRPNPKLVADVIKRLRYKPGWHFKVEADALLINIVTEDSTGKIATRYGKVHVAHRRPIPPPEMVGDWERWVLEQIVAVETHEACEFFRLDGRTPFDPHVPGMRARDGIHRSEPVVDVDLRLVDQRR